MEFRKKIDKLLSIKGIKLYKLAEISEMGNTLEKAYQENREMTKTSTDKFLHNSGVNPEWWRTQTGPEFLPQVAENHTPVQNKATIPEKPLGEEPFLMYKNLIEGVSEYTLVPKQMIGKTEDAMRETIKAKNDLIEHLKREIALYRSRTAAKKAK